MPPTRTPADGVDLLPGTGTLVLVEGDSDRAAVLALASRNGIDLTARGVQVLAMGGVTNIGHYVQRFGPHGAGLRLTGLCDLPETRFVRRALELGGILSDDGSDLGSHGFFVCDADLEDELIRALGTDAVLAIAEREGDGRAFRSLQQQPAQRDRPVAAQLRRWLGSGARRKIHYAPLMVTALEDDRVPAALAGVLAAAVTASQ